MMMVQKSIKFLLTLTIALFSVVTFAQHEESHGAKEGNHDTHAASGNLIDTPEEVKAYSEHHLKDSHDFSLYINGSTGEHVGFPLPVIVWTSKGVRTFMSSAFHHNDDGHVLVEKDGVTLTKIHSKIYELDSEATAVTFDDSHHATNAAKVLDFSITKSVVGMLLASLLMFLGFSSLARG